MNELCHAFSAIIVGALVIVAARFVVPWIVKLAIHIIVAPDKPEWLKEKKEERLRFDGRRLGQVSSENRWPTRTEY